MQGKASLPDTIKSATKKTTSLPIVIVIVDAQITSCKEYP